MPYKRVGKIVYHKKAGRWSIKQKCTSTDNAKAVLRLLNNLEDRE